MDCRRPPHRQQRLEGVALVPAFDESPDQPRADPIRTIVVEQFDQLVQRMFGDVDDGCVEQAFLVAEEVVDHRDVDAGIGGDPAHGGLFVAVLEVLAGHLEDALLILLARAPSAGPPRFSHGVQRTSTPVDVYRPAGVTSSSATVEEGGIEDGSSTNLVAALAFSAARAGNDDG